MEDNAILDLYFARDEAAITETDQKYGGYCFSIANRILNSNEDSEETVGDTLWQAWNSIPEAVSRPDHPQPCIQPLAEIVSHEARRRGDGTCTGRIGGMHPRQ